MTVSGGQQRDLATYIIHVTTLPKLLPPRPPHNAEQSSLCCTQALAGDPFLNKQCVHVHPKLPDYPSPHPPPVLLVCFVLFFKYSDQLIFTMMDNKS